MNTRSVWRPDKDEVVVEHGAVATAHPIAAQVGVDILKSGGNAVDAAIATGFCLNVVEPASSSIAGHGQMIVHMTAQNDRNPCRSIAVDYGHRAPRAATADMFRVIGQAVKGNGIYEVEDQANAIGHRSAGVPGVTAGMCRAHQLFGSLPLEQLLEPAVHYAREGFEVDPATCLQIARNMPNLLRYGETARVFLRDGLPPPYVSPSPFEGALHNSISVLSQDQIDDLSPFAPPRWIPAYAGMTLVVQSTHQWMLIGVLCFSLGSRLRGNDGPCGVTLTLALSHRGRGDVVDA